MSDEKPQQWIERDEDFVHRSKIRSGWEKEHSSFTDYLLGGEAPKTPEAQVKEIYQLCRNRSDNMSVDGTHSLKFSATEETGHTDGKAVYVSTRVLDEKKPFAKKVDIMLGITTHEMCHVQHTDWDLLEKEIKDEFTHSVWNTIEDERIEHKMGEEYPGYAGSLAAVKEYFFDEKYLLEEAIKKGKTLSKGATAPIVASGDDEEEINGVPKHLIAEDPKEDLTTTMSEEEKASVEIYDQVFKLIRYPKYVDADIVSKHETAIDEIKNILTPYPETAAQAIEASKKVAKVLKKEIEEEMGGGKAAKGIMEAITTMMESQVSPNEKGKPLPSTAVMKYDYKDEYIEDKEYRAVIRKAEPNEYQFKIWHDEVKGEAKRLAQILRTKAFSESRLLHGMRNGALDDAKIVEAIHGVKTVHTITIPKVSKTLNITILIDESGSMGGGSKYQNAAKAAILLQEAFRIFPVGKLFVYGFTSDDSPDFNTIFRYLEPGSGIDIKYGLGSVSARASNRDGHAIRVAARRVRMFTKVPMLYFIISDGMPAGHMYNGTAAMLDTRKAVQEVAKMNFFPIQIGINVNPNDQKVMFDDFVTYSSPRQMVEDLRKLLFHSGEKYMGM